MRRLMLVKSWLGPLVPLLFLLGLWALLWGSLGAQDLRWTLNPADQTDFLIRGLRATFPLFAGGMAVMIIAVKLPRRPDRSILFSPLGLVALYGVVGLAAALLSPKGWVSLYWAVAYLSVPLVIWAVVWSSNALDQIVRLIKFNWLIVVLLVGVVFVVGVLYLDLGTRILHPETLLSCGLSQSWFDLTSGILRDTGVGRFAAIAAIIALSSLWWKKWRIVWGLVLLGSLLLLITSGARTAILGFAIVAPIIILLHGGKRAAVAGILAIIILVPLVWSTGMHHKIAQNCLFKGFTAGTSLLTPPVQASTQGGSGEQALLTEQASANENSDATGLLAGQASADENSDATGLLAGQASANKNSDATGLLEGQASTNVNSDATGLPTEQASTPEISDGEAIQQLNVPHPLGAWVLQRVSSPEGITPDAPGSLSVPPGTWVLERVTPATPISAEESTDIPPITSHSSAPAPPASAPATTTGPTPAPTSTPATTAGPTPAPTSAPATTTGPTPAPTSTPAELDSGGPPAQLQVPPGSWVLKISLAQQNAGSAASGIVEVPPGSWVLKQVPMREPPGSDVQGSGQVSSTEQVEQPLASAALSTRQESQVQASTSSEKPKSGAVPLGFYTLSGRTVVWKAAWKRIEDSPLLGYGFHADRLLLGTHMHNSFLHAMIQTGVIGTIPLMGAFLLGAILLIRALRNLGRLPLRHKHLVIQTGGVFLFLLLRALPESTGAFFGADLFLLGPILLYLGLVNQRRFIEEESR